MSDTEHARTRRITLGRNSGRTEMLAESAAVAASGDGLRARDPEAAAFIEAPFPESRLLRWTPQLEPGDTAPENDVALVVTQEVLADVNRHVARSLEQELGGFLLGNLYRCPNSGREYVIVDQSTRAQLTESSQVHLAFTLDTWAHLSEELSGKFVGKLVVGWYHSHPRMDVFLSACDVAIHEERFAERWMTALVIEPEKNRGGFFRWHDGKLNARVPSEFYELVARRADRAVVEWTNYSLAGGHRPEPSSNGRNSRPFLTRGFSALAQSRDTGELDDPRPTPSLMSRLGLVLVGVLLGALLCGVGWLVADWPVVSDSVQKAPEPLVAEPVPATQAPEPVSVAPAAADPPKNEASRPRPKRRRAAPKPKQQPASP